MSDLTPLLPDRLSPKRAYVDFVLALDYLSPNSRLLALMQRAMSSYGLSLLLVNEKNVQRAIADVQAGDLRPIVYLDMCSRPGDDFEVLLKAMAGAGVHAVAHPDHLAWTYKAHSHPKLEQAGLPVPPTVILHNGDPDRALTTDELARLGERVVIKPSYGVAGLGAVIGAAPTLDEIRKAREYERTDDWLIQRMVSWRKLEHRDAYLRGYNVLGCRTLMWWDPRAGYGILTWDDLREHDLLGAVGLVDQVAQTCGLEFFSTEIAITDSPDQRFVLIDYVNDQCDIDPSAAPGRSPPEQWVQWVCTRFAEFTWRKKHGLAQPEPGEVYLADR